MAKPKNSFHVFPYNLQLITPLKTSKEDIRIRSGLCLLLRCKDKIGIGTTPALNPIYINNYLKKLNELAEKIYVYSGPEIFMAEVLKLKGIDPVLTAVEIAARDIISQNKNITFGASFSPGRVSEPRIRQLPVRALINSGLPDLPAELEKIKSTGYKALKLKVGDPASPDLGLQQDIQNIQTIKDAMGDIPLSLDANGAYPMDRVHDMLKSFSRLGIEYIEEPVAGIFNLIKLSRSSPIPVAVDESCDEFKTMDLLAGEDDIETIIIKPTSFTNLQILYSKIENLIDAGKKVVISSGIDSAVGLLATMHFAATLKEAENTFTGLDTSKLIVKELIGFSFVLNGWLEMPEGPGLGAKIPEAYRQLLRN